MYEEVHNEVYAYYKEAQSSTRIMSADRRHLKQLTKELIARGKPDAATMAVAEKITNPSTLILAFEYIDQFTKNATWQRLESRKRSAAHKKRLSHLKELETLDALPDASRIPSMISYIQDSRFKDAEYIISGFKDEAQRRVAIKVYTMLRGQMKITEDYKKKHGIPENYVYSADGKWYDPHDQSRPIRVSGDLKKKFPGSREQVASTNNVEESVISRKPQKLFLTGKHPSEAEEEIVKTYNNADEAVKDLLEDDESEQVIQKAVEEVVEEIEEEEIEEIIEEPEPEPEPEEPKKLDDYLRSQEFRELMSAMRNASQRLKKAHVEDFGTDLRVGTGDPHPMAPPWVHQDWNTCKEYFTKLGGKAAWQSRQYSFRGSLQGTCTPLMKITKLGSPIHHWNRQEHYGIIREIGDGRSSRYGSIIREAIPDKSVRRIVISNRRRYLAQCREEGREPIPSEWPGQGAAINGRWALPGGREKPAGPPLEAYQHLCENSYIEDFGSDDTVGTYKPHKTSPEWLRNEWYECKEYWNAKGGWSTIKQNIFNSANGNHQSLFLVAKAGANNESWNREQHYGIIRSVTQQPLVRYGAQMTQVVENDIDRKTLIKLRRDYLAQCREQGKIPIREGWP